MIDIESLDFDKGNGLIPTIVQEAGTGTVLMLGYMDRAALEQTLESKQVTFFSRSKNRLWTKGETSGNYLHLKNITADCDNDTLLVTAVPNGPTCHTGTKTCWGDEAPSLAFLAELGALIKQRHADMPEGSYTTSLFEAGKERISQKVGEEGVEVALAHMSGDRDKILNESADLIYHTLVLLENAGLSLNDVADLLRERHRR
ncbi:MAG: bifunctional phosphoribosyl-AMP cyclohydrolase/phosphoribosyl-ATP diphosphatase HisIE [Rhodospirillales bacterium]|nr:bifunctional phosphoribosyl-AMP cyclohydrolase/phosphoribosyl-ATP diphosphatase HisIE [Rhodospirillales bacterium]